MAFLDFPNILSGRLKADFWYDKSRDATRVVPRDTDAWSLEIPISTRRARQKRHYCAATKVLTMRVVTDKRWTHATTKRDKTGEQGVQPTPSNPFPIESSRSHIHGVAE